MSSGEHPFYVLGRDGFVPADELRPGDSFLLASGGTATAIDIEVERGPPGSCFTTYNFEVADFHTYFAGPSGVWVHNRGAPCDEFFALVRRLVDRDPNRDWLKAHDRALNILEHARAAQGDGPISGTTFHSFAMGVMREIYGEPGAPKPSYVKLKTAWAGRLASAELEINHTVPEVWIDALFRKASLTAPDSSTINSVPGLAMWRQRHNLGVGPPGQPTFHDLLEQRIGRTPTPQQTISNITDALRLTYQDMNQLYGPVDGIDYEAVWAAARQWLNAKGVP